MEVSFGWKVEFHSVKTSNMVCFIGEYTINVGYTKYVLMVQIENLYVQS